MRKIQISKNKMIVGIIAMIILIFGIGYVYINSGYKADETVTDIRNINSNTEGIEVLVDGDYTYFVPKDNVKKTGIIFYPGGKVEAKAYINLMMSIAKQGYTTVLVNVPYNLAILGINDALVPIEEFENDSWYIAGHSLGGLAAAEFAKNSDEIEGLILLASYPSSDLSDSDLKVLSICGSEDKIIDINNYEKAKIMLPKRTEYFTIDGGNHGQFGNYGEQKGDGKAKISVKEQQEITAIEINEFIEGRF